MCFVLFLTTSYSINWSNPFLITGLIFYISCSSKLSKYSLDTQNQLMKPAYEPAFVCTLSVLYHLIPSNLFLILKDDGAYFLSTFLQYFRSYSLGFPPLYITVFFWKGHEKKFKLLWNNSKLFCNPDFRFLYVFSKIFWKIYEIKIYLN